MLTESNDYILIKEVMYVFIFGLIISKKYIGFFLSLIVSGIKVSFPLIYFSYFFNGGMGGDDVVYYENGKKLLEFYENPFLFFSEVGFYNKLVDISQGHHILYDWFNMLSQWLFGEYYFSAVLLNVGLTFIAGSLLYKISILFFSKSYSTCLFIFFILHWDVITWSSFDNIKDTIVLTLTLGFFYSFYYFLKEKKFLWLIFSIGYLLAFYFIRYYLSIFIILSLILFFIQKNNILKSSKNLIICIFGLIIYFTLIGFSSINNFFEGFEIGNLFGGLKMSLSPRPWGLSEEYKFLLIPSIFHWVLYFPMIIGLYLLWKEKIYLRILIIYGILLFIFYGFTPYLAGPRQKYQLIFIIAWGQFNFLWHFIINKYRAVKI